MIRDLLEHLATVARGVAAVFAGVLPRRYWNALPQLPIGRLTMVSAIVTMACGWAIGVPGFFAYSERMGRIAAELTIKVAEAQLKGELPEDPALNVAPIQMSVLTPFAFALFTPVGLIATYLIVSGLARVTMGIVDQAIGDPILTGVDAIIHRTARRARHRRHHRAREREEGAEAVDRLYTGEWAGLTGVDFVVVASRRKPDWEEGAFVITSEKWYTLGAPFDLRLPEGLRTVYPLKEQTQNDVLRRGVPYELPPLSRAKRAPTSPREPRR